MIAQLSCAAAGLFLWGRRQMIRVWIVTPTRLVTIVLGVANLVLAPAAQPVLAESRPQVVTVRLENEAITPVTARFLQRGIREANERQVECLVILLDTPGGLVTSTGDIVKSILNSQVPIVVYVFPSGSRAASAGGFILLSAHIAAMAPTTRVGAMHPVSIGGLPTAPQPDTPESGEDSGNGVADKTKRPRAQETPQEVKIVNDTVAWARGLAELRGRNVDWAERAVRESLVSTEQQALEDGTIDFVAADLEELLSKLDGRTVVLPGRTVTLNTKNAEVQRLEMWWGEQILATISSPNIAFLLLIFGFYGVLFEFYTPGWGVAGTLGIVCLLLGFLGLAVLPINYIGLVLIAVALGMFVAEAFVASFGALTIGGIICLVMGGLMLVDSPGGFLRISLWVVVPVAVGTAAITVFLVGSIVRVHRQKAVTGSEGLIGQTGVAVEAFHAVGEHYEGMIRVHGELWKAVCSETVAAAQTIRITSREGLTLTVERSAISASISNSKNVTPGKGNTA
jgi:membrane-bound serine protease (ClpP class)